MFSIRSTLLLVLIVGGTSSMYVFLGLNLMTLIALGLACLLYVPLIYEAGRIHDAATLLARMAHD